MKVNKLHAAVVAALTGAGYTLRAVDPANVVPGAVSEPFDVTFPPVQLVVGTELSDREPVEGDTVTITITVANTSGVPAEGVEFASPLPDRLEFVSAAPSQGSYDVAAGSWRVGTLAAQAAAQLVIVVKVKEE